MGRLLVGFLCLGVCSSGCAAASAPAQNGQRPTAAAVDVEVAPPSVASGEPASTAVEAGLTIPVASPLELVRALGSHRTLRLTAARYRLDAALETSTDVATWESVYDGHQLIVSDVEDLTIEGAPRPNGARPIIEIAPRYAWVFKFVKSKHVKLRGLTLGHTTEGACVGGVVGVERSEDVSIENCDLYGSGTYGVGLNKVVRFRLSDSTIRDCSYGIMTVEDSRDVVVERSSFSNNRQYDLIEVTRTQGLRFKDVTCTENRADSGHSLFKLDNGSRVTIEGGKWHNPLVPLFSNRPSQLDLRGGAASKLSSELNKADPQLNQLYRVVPFGSEVLTLSQAGITVFHAASLQVKHRQAAKLATSSALSRGSVFVGSYEGVYRYDGSGFRRYLPTTYANHSVFELRASPGAAKTGNVVWARVGREFHQYDATLDRFLRAAPTNLPQLDAYDVVTDTNGAVWAIQFLQRIVRLDRSGVKSMTKLSPEYPGRDPRRFALDGAALWVYDFESGCFRWDGALGRFSKQGSLTEKCTGVRRLGGVSYYLHYTRGLVAERVGKAPESVPLPSLQYYSDLAVDGTGSLLVATHEGLVKVTPKGSGYDVKHVVVK